jgi:hypothetical protein
MSRQHTTIWQLHSRPAMSRQHTTIWQLHNRPAMSRQHTTTWQLHNRPAALLSIPSRLLSTLRHRHFHISLQLYLSHESFTFCCYQFVSWQILFSCFWNVNQQTRSFFVPKDDGTVTCDMVFLHRLVHTVPPVWGFDPGSIVWEVQGHAVMCSGIMVTMTRRAGSMDEHLFCTQFSKFSGHYMYRPVVTIRTTHWSLYVPPSGHYMYRTMVTICTAQWSLYVPPV